MKSRKPSSRSYRLLVGRNRRFITDLIKFRAICSEDISPKDEGPPPNIETKNGKLRVTLARALLRFKQRMRDVASTGMYCANTFQEWLGFTFCCIVIRRKKRKGILKSARI